MVREKCFAVSSSGNQDKEEDRYFTTFQTNSYKKKKTKKIITCAFCSEDHSSDKCSNVTDISQQKQLSRKNERCFICLRKIISPKMVSQTTSEANAK